MKIAINQISSNRGYNYQNKKLNKTTSQTCPINNKNDFNIYDKLCAVPFVNVMLTDSTGKIVNGCQTDTNGKYHIYNIPKGESL